MSHTQDSEGRVTLLELGEEGGDVPFAVAMGESSWSNFPQGFDFYEGEEICVTGVVADYQSTSVIFVLLPSEIQVRD